MERINKIDENIGEVVEDYIEENPIEVDLSDYYTIQQVDNIISTIELTPGPAGPQGAPGKDGAPGAPGQDGKDYILTDADKQEIADMVDVSGADVDLSDYYTKEEIDNMLSNLPSGGDIPSGEGVEF